MTDGDGLDWLAGPAPSAPPEQQDGLDWLTSESPATFGEQAKGAVFGVAQGLLGTASDIVEAPAILSRGLGFGTPPGFDAAAQGLRSIQPDTNPYRQDTSEMLGQAVGSGATFLGPGLAARAVGKGASIATTAALGAAANFSAGYHDAKMSGATDEQSFHAALLNGIAGLSQAVPAETILSTAARTMARANRMSGGWLKRAAVDLALGSLSEGGQEAFQQTAQNVIAKSLAGYDQDRDALAGVAQAGALGAFGGLFFGGLAHAAGHMASQPDTTGKSSPAAGSEDLSKTTPDTQLEQDAPRGTPGRTYATEVAAQHGAAVEFDPTLGEKEQGAYEGLGQTGLGQIRLNPNLSEADIEGVVLHELTHHLREVRGETWEEMTAAIARSDPKGFQKAFSQYAADFKRARGQDVDPDLQREEAAARYVQGISSYVRQAMEDPASLEQKAPGVLHSIAHAVVRMLDAAKIGVPERLRKYVETPLAQARHAGIAKEVAKALATLRDTRRKEAAAAPATKEASVPDLLPSVARESAPAPSAPVVDPGAAPAAAPGETVSKRAPLDVPAQMPRGAQIGVDLTGEPVYAKEERGDLKRPGSDVAQPKVTQIGAFDEEGSMFQADAEARDQGLPPPSALRVPSAAETARTRAREKGPLRSFIRAIGGIKYDANEGADLHNTFSQKEGGKGSFGLGPLVHGPKSAKGLHWEEAMRAAVDAGFFPGRTYGDITYQEFYDAIEGDISREPRVEERMQETGYVPVDETDAEREAIYNEQSLPKSKRVKDVPFAIAPRSLAERLEAEHPGSTVEISHVNRKDPYGRTVWYVDSVVVPKEQRGQGVGSKIMQSIVDAADAEGATIALTPSTDFGATSVSRLRSFYSRFGFRRNLGSRADSSITGAMIRVPKGRTKYAVAPTGSFDEPPDKLGFYSQLEASIAEKMPGSATVAQVRSIAKQGSKAEEYEWSGLDEWLKGKAKVSKEEVLQFLRESNVRVDEVVLGGDAQANLEAAEQRFIAEATWNYSAARQAWSVDRARDAALDVARGERPVESLPAWLRDHGARLRNAYTDRGDAERPTKFTSYQTPGGKNYSELLLTLPGRTDRDLDRLRIIHDDALRAELAIRDAARRPIFDKYAAEIEEAQRRATDYSLTHNGRMEWQAKRDLLKARRDSEAARAGNAAVINHPTVTSAVDRSRAELQAAEDLAGKSKFTSGHFDTPNVLAHVRFNERTTPDGRRVLFLEEVQSDWHQKGRERGYAPDAAGLQAAVRAAKASVDRLRDEAAERTKEYMRDPRVTAIVAEEEALGRDYFNENVRNDPAWQVVDYSRAAHGSRKREWNELTGGEKARVWEELSRAGGDTAKRFRSLKDELQPFLRGLEDVDQRLQEARIVYQDAVNALRDAGDGVPNAPFKSTWHDLAMKRMVRYAAERGFDEIAWTTGAMQIERYNEEMRQNVDKIQVEPRLHGGAYVVPMREPAGFQVQDRGRFLGHFATEEEAKKVAREYQVKTENVYVRAFKDGQERFGAEVPIEGSTTLHGHKVALEDIVGKDIARQIREKPNKSHSFEGEGLAIGGKGMQTFYDQMLGASANKIGKKFGVQVAPTEIDTGSTADRYDSTERNSELVPSLPITEAMRKSVMARGLPRFAIAPSGSFDLPDDTRTRQFTRAVLDSFEALRLTPELDRAISLRPGLAYGRAERVQAQTIRGMIEVAKKVGKEQADRFLYALHAPRRNEIIQERSEGKHGLESNPGSGMKTSEAQRIVRQALSGPNRDQFQRLRDLNRRLNVERLDAMESSGLISHEQRTAYEEFGPDYVPLRTAEDPDERYGGGSLNVVGAESKRAEGRSSLADSPLSFGVASFARAAERSARNHVGQLLADFVEQNPTKEWGVYQSKDAIPEGWEVLSLKRDGAPVYIGTSNKAIATAFKQMDQKKAEGVMRAAVAFRRLMHALIIKYNPPFAVSNAFRDVGTAAAKMAIQDRVGTAARVVKNAPAAMLGAWQAIRTEGAGGKWGAIYREARDAGALIGWNEMASFQDVEDAVKRSKRSAILTAIEQANRAAELGTRLAIYDAMKAQGKTSEEAALASRDGTTDFARRGNYSSQISALYLFANANIQGSASLWRAIAANPVRGSFVIGALAAAGYLASMASRAWGDWEDIPDYAKRRMGGIAVGDTLYGIPLPYGFDVFWYLGSRLEAQANGHPQDSLGADILTATLQSFSPVQGANVIQALTPTALRPAVEIDQNEDWAGIPIRPRQSPFDRTPTPRSEQAFASVNPTLKAGVQALNRATGGDSVRSGVIDVSAEDVEHVIKFLGGGAGANATRLVTVLDHWLRGDPVRGSDVPFVRTLMTQVPESAVANHYYDNLTAIEREVEAKKAGEEVLDQHALSLAAFARVIDRRVRELRKQRKATTDPERVAALDKRIREAQAQLNERMYGSSK